MSSTGFAKAKYTEIYDICTQPDSPTMIGVHTPVGNRPLGLLAGFFTQFKKFKYAGCKITLIPTSTLPLDPLQVGFEAGQTVDPRDALNPILHKGYIGESLGYFVDRYLYSDVANGSDSVTSKGEYPSIRTAIASKSTSRTAFEHWYYNNLLDPSWRKSDPQRGFQKSGLHPRMWALGSSQPINNGVDGGFNLTTGSYGPTNGIDDISNMSVRGNVAQLGHPATNITGDATTLTEPETMMFALRNGVGNPVFFESTKSVPIGWKDTITRTGWLAKDQSGLDASWIASQNPPALYTYTALGKHFMYLIVLPKSYNTVYYWRMVIQHYYQFKGFRLAIINQPNRTYPVEGVQGSTAYDDDFGYDTVSWPASKSPEIEKIHDTEIITGDTLDTINASVDLVADSVA
ncbi:Cap [Porprismacovirus bovas3]|uniref:Cap n=1 Tax=Genomoviridae sp. TaxID=2202565 RepID=A0A4D6TYH5_9VIRU|nr:Cap [Genomoviridae sp.]